MSSDDNAVMMDSNQQNGVIVCKGKRKRGVVAGQFFCMTVKMGSAVKARDFMGNQDCLLLKNQLCFPLYVCSREMVNAYRPFLDELGITYTQYITLMVLWEEHHATVKLLCQKLHLDSGTLTPLLKKLELKGLITRERSNSDERSVIAVITGKGMELREKALQIPANMANRIDGFTVEDISQLRALLERLIQKLTAK